MKKVLLFGASKLGESALNILKSTNNIIGFIDNDKNKWGKEFNSLPVYAPSFIIENDVEIIITSSYSNQIVEQLQNINFWEFSIFKYQLQKPDLVNSSVIKNHLPSIATGKLLQDVDEELTINDLTFLSGGSSIMDYFFLKVIMQKCEFSTYLEIGTWTGESIAAVAEVAEQCYSVSLPDNDQALIATFEKYCNKDNFSRYFSNSKENVTHYYDSSLTFDYKQIKDKIDLVFIDGDHSYDAIKQDTENIFNLVGFEESIVVWHDFKTIRNELVQTTYEAIKAVLPEKYMKNLFTVNTNICGIYIPSKLQNHFSIEEESKSLYSYKVSLTPKMNSL